MRSETTRLLALARPYRGLLTGALVCSFIASALDGITIVLLVPLLKHLFGTTGALRTGATPLERWLTDTFAPLLANTTPGQAVARMAVVLGVGLLLKNLAEYLSSQFNTRMQEGLVASLRRQLYDHLLQLDLGFFHRTRTGLLVTALINETDQAKGIVTASMVTLIRNLFLLATTLFILGSISIRLTLLSLVVVPPLAIGLRMLTRRIRRHSRARADERGELAALATERLAGIRLVRTSDAAAEEEALFADSVERYRKRVVRTGRFAALTGPMSETVAAVLVMLVVYAGTNPHILGLSAPLAPEVIIVFLLATLRLTSPIKAISQFPTNWAQGMASVEKVFSLLDEPALETDDRSGRQATFTQDLVYDHVSFEYETGARVLHDISFRVTPGRVVALVGPSGAGKSTLVDLLPRLRDPTLGRVLLDGVPLADLSRSSLRHLMGVVSQDTVLFHESIHANIAYGVPGATRADVERAAEAANAHEFVVRLPEGYDTILGERGMRISGGQRQRIAIARALLRNAPILILDEATSALDTQSERLVQEAIERLMANRTVLVIAHRLATVRQADEILVLDEGRIIQRGSHIELLAAGGLYRRLYELQFRDDGGDCDAGSIGRHARMSGPFAGTRVLLVDVETDPTGHAGLRKRALERLGCLVATCDLKEKKGLLSRWRGGSSQERLGKAVLQHQAQLVLVVEGAELTAGMITSLKRDSDAVWAAWFIGDTRSLPLMEALSAAYDVLFVPGTDLVEQLRGASRPPTLHLPPGCDPSVHRPMKARDQFRANVVFVGAATPRREQLLGELTEFGLAIWGPGWRRTPLKDYCRGEMLELDDYVRAYAGASVAVNIHREGTSNGGTATGCNQRLFELAAIGVAQVVDNRADLPLAFDTGRELLTFNSGSELRLLVQELLQDPTTAERLAQAGRRRALAEHTYMHRLGAILGATKR